MPAESRAARAWRHQDDRVLRACVLLRGRHGASRRGDNSGQIRQAERDAERAQGAQLLPSADRHRGADPPRRRHARRHQDGEHPRRQGEAAQAY